MTTLLTADEAARLVPGVNVIVRAGESNDGPLPSFDSSVERTWEPFVAPQDWVKLTGPCPDKFCRNGEVQYPEWEGEVRKCESCRDGRRIVPLYAERAGYDGPGERVAHLVLVGRGSIEVVPVVEHHGDAYDGMTLPVICVNEDGRAYMHVDYDAARPLGVDPLPVPGRDFGIVIDCSEVAT